ncbi:hypothetical protein EJ08DRAFT_646760 [Tothia fuscella]|uniref:Uncharacterized protein n=1 Tax=Tothia fuscella TaxID=1048955 RepID=A0A9P4NZS5_9PEZI|nr:hypothetical protein EJ08DRAFT_646760 [Tothia fuscella]
MLRILSLDLLILLGLVLYFLVCRWILLAIIEVRLENDRSVRLKSKHDSALEPQSIYNGKPKKSSTVEIEDARKSGGIWP